MRLPRRDRPQLTRSLAAALLAAELRWRRQGVGPTWAEFAGIAWPGEQLTRPQRRGRLRRLRRQGLLAYGEGVRGSLRPTQRGLRAALRVAEEHRGRGV